MDFFTMTRRGSLVPQHVTNNQCKEPGHARYFYELQVVFQGSTPWDKNSFIVEHSELDSAIKKCHATGSCEQMHVEIREHIHSFFSQRKLKKYVVAFKFTIYPTLSDIKEGAFMSCVYVAAGVAPEGVMSLLK